MPSKSKKQARTMRGAAHNKGYATRMGIGQDVARDFMKADQSIAKKRKKSKPKRPRPASSSY